MSKKDRCRKVSILLQTMPKRGCEETLRVVCDHLSECEACRSLHADLQEMDRILLENKAWFDEVAGRSPIGKARIITERPTLAKGRGWRVRAVWAGAAAILLVIAAAAVFLPFDEGDHAPRRARPPAIPTPVVTQAMAAESSSRTLLGVAEVVSRRKAPSLGVSYPLPSLPRESFYPQLLRQSALESDARLGRIVQSKIALGTPSVPRRQSFVPRLRQQSTLESDHTLGRILRSRINLTRREET